MFVSKIAIVLVRFESGFPFRRYTATNTETACDRFDRHGSFRDPKVP